MLHKEYSSTSQELSPARPLARLHGLVSAQEYDHACVFPLREPPKRRPDTERVSSPAILDMDSHRICVVNKHLATVTKHGFNSPRIAELKLLFPADKILSRHQGHVDAMTPKHPCRVLAKGLELAIGPCILSLTHHVTISSQSLSVP